MIIPVDLSIVIPDPVPGPQGETGPAGPPGPSKFFASSIVDAVMVPAEAVKFVSYVTALTLPLQGDSPIAIESVLQFNVDDPKADFFADFGVSDPNGPDQPNAPYVGQYHLKRPIHVVGVSSVRISRIDLIPADTPCPWVLQKSPDGKYPMLVLVVTGWAAGGVLYNVGTTMSVL